MMFRKKEGLMKNTWNDQDLTKALKKMAETKPQASFDHVWFKIEEKLEARHHHVWNNFVWKPWGHPVRWVMAAACLCVALTGVSYHQNSQDQADMASYMLSVSNPTENVAKDLGVTKVSILLSEPSSTASDVKVDDHLDSIAADEILL
jgi:hypothetical protein